MIVAVIVVSGIFGVLAYENILGLPSGQITQQSSATVTPVLFGDNNSSGCMSGVNQLDFNITQIALHQSGASNESWIVVYSGSPITVNLARLENSANISLGVFSAPAGNYDALVIIISGAFAVVDGSYRTLGIMNLVPSSEGVGGYIGGLWISLSQPLSIQPGEKASVNTQIEVSNTWVKVGMLNLLGSSLES